MSTGTKGGLLDDGDQHAQSVFKHQILKQYLPLFIAMTGSTAPGKRLVVLDGFAGRGRYRDGKPQSGELILQAMLNQNPMRDVSSFFVEKNNDDFEVLASVVQEYVARGLAALALPGKVEDHLDQVLDCAAKVPLFMFLDPCGAGVSYERLVNLLTGPRNGKRPQTEVLLNFSADMSRRVTGALNSGRTDQRTMDAACGGGWWRPVAQQALRTSPSGTFEPVVHAVAAEYARRVGAACNMTSVSVPVYRKLGHQPIYHLVFFTRSPFGLWVFADAIAKARQHWLRHLGKLADASSGAMLWTYAQDMADRIEKESQQAHDIIVANLRQLLATTPGCRLVDRPREVFGSAYGAATEATVMKAVRSLAAAGELAIIPSRSQPRKTVIKRP